MEQNISVQVCICSTESMSHNFDAGVVSWIMEWFCFRCGELRMIDFWLSPRFIKQTRTRAGAVGGI